MLRARALPLSFLPIPALLVLIIMLYTRVDPAVRFDPPWLILICNTLFVTVVCLAVCAAAMRNYRATGQSQVLLLGCGVLAFGIGGALAGAARGLPDGANLNVTIYNTGALMGALCHFGAAFLLIAGQNLVVAPPHRQRWFLAGYGASILFMAMLAIASLSGWIPPFQDPGALGFTPLRQAVLGSAVVLFAFSFVAFLGMYLRNREVFLYWYACALVLTAISLSAFFIQSSVGSPVGWAGRASQYLGGVYFLTSIITATRCARARKTTFQQVLVTSLTGAEQTFRALFEQTTVGLSRADPKTSRLLQVNQAFANMLGYTRDELQQMTFVDITHPEDRPRDLAGFAPVRTGAADRWEIEKRYLRKDGSVVWAHVSGNLIRHEDGTPDFTLAVIQDITERKHAEETLRDRDARFTALLANLETGVAAVDEDGRFVLYNDSFLRIFGLSSSSTVSNVNEQEWERWLVFAENGQLLELDEHPVRKAVLTGHAVRNQLVRIRRPSDNQELWLLISADPILKPDGGLRLLICTYYDLTARKQIEMDLERVRFTLSEGQRIAHVGSFEYIADTRTTLWSEEEYRIYGLDPAGSSPTYDVLLAKHIHPDDAALLDRTFMAAMRTGDIYELEHRIIRPDGTVRWVHDRANPYFDPSGKLLRYIGATLDITERKQVEERGAATVRRVELLARTAGELLRSSEPQKVVESLCRQVMEQLDCQAFFNFLVAPGAGRLHLNACAGIPPEEARSIEWLDFGTAICGCAARDGSRIVAEHIATGCDPRTDLVRSYGIQAYACHPLLGPRGEVLGTLSFGARSRETFSEDDLELMKAVADHVAVAMVRQRTADQLQAATLSAEQAKSLAESASKAKDQFIAVLSHELRTPLTPVMAALGLLRTDSRLPSDVREDLDMVSRNIDLEVRLIADLLDVSRIISGKFHLEKRPVDVSDAIREAGKIVSGDLDAKDQTLTLETVGAPFWAFADAARLQQVFWNLLRNSIKFSPEHSRISVRARVEPVQRCPLAAQPCPVGLGDCPLPGATAGNGELKGGNLVVEVVDQGCGIDPHLLPRLFNAFEQDAGARSFGGLGLGLSICRAVVEMHGGTIAAHSDGIGCGATITVRLPVAQCALTANLRAKPPAYALGDRNTSEAPARSGALRVLLVEDHVDTAKLLQRLLMAEGYHVTVAGNMAKGLAAVQQTAPDVLISDLGLPDGSGLDLIRQLRARGIQLPAIALSGYGTSADMDKSKAAGFAEHLTKPLQSVESLYAAIARLGVASGPERATGGFRRNTDGGKRMDRLP